MIDPYEWLENIDDPKVREWAVSISRETESRLSRLSRELYPRILRYMRRPLLMQARVTEKGLFLLFRGEEYWVERMDEEGHRSKILSSRNLGSDAIVHWINTDRSGGRLAYFYSFAGLDEGILKILDPVSLEELDELRGSIGGLVWIDKHRYYYARFYRSGHTPDGVPAPAERIFLRDIGAGEEMVFGEGLKTSYMVDMESSLDNRMALITVSYGWMETSFYAGRLEEPSTWRIVLRSDSPLRPLGYRDDRYLLLSYEGNEGFGKLIEVDAAGEPRTLLQSDFPVKWAVPMSSGILVSFMRDAAENLRFYDYEGRLEWEEIFRKPGSLYAPHSVGSKAVFIYTSFDTPYKLYVVERRGLTPLLEDKLSIGMAVDHEWATSEDGTRIHMFKVFRRGAGGKKVLIYGYGGFGISLTPRFYPHVIPFLEDGGVFMVANLRGGGEYGEKWHKAGMRHNKRKVFEDFAACIRLLKEKGARVVAMGSSNGGLLVGATLALYPGMLDGAVIGYPVLDMLKFHKLYIGAAWIPEYGDPEDPEDREYLASYSPYHNLRPDAPYPPILVHTGLNDDRVHPGHAFKFVARLREFGAPVLLRVETRSGHSGASPRVKAAEYADIMAFIYDVLGLKPAEH